MEVSSREDDDAADDVVVSARPSEPGDAARGSGTAVSRLRRPSVSQRGCKKRRNGGSQTVKSIGQFKEVMVVTLSNTNDM